MSKLPRHEEELLRTAVLGVPRTQLLAAPELTTTQAEELAALVARRKAGEPLQYIIGRAPFRYLELAVTPDVLIPRPETETLVQLVIDWWEETKGTRDGDGDAQVLDVGTGSGAIAIALASEVGVRLVATDISAPALALAEENAAAAGVAQLVDFVLCDVCEGIVGPFDVLVSNPPYVTSAQMSELPAEIAEWEPHQALDGGTDGLDVLRKIVPAAKLLLRPGGLLALELEEDNVRQAAALLDDAWTAVNVHQDLTGRERFLTATRAR
ncbi:MAG: peptide chain release factor N(5)-glutamine methyltransferase [Coriobacteriales bacterium]|nr:peptide chain release factor N(5)-glutamine methyltransferase [Coriobacteriales bacterium]